MCVCVCVYIYIYRERERERERESLEKIQLDSTIEVLNYLFLERVLFLNFGIKSETIL